MSAVQSPDLETRHQKVDDPSVPVAVSGKLAKPGQPRRECLASWMPFAKAVVVWSERRRVASVVRGSARTATLRRKSQGWMMERKVRARNQKARGGDEEAA